MDTATIARLGERTRNGGAEIVELMRTGGAFFAPASAASVMVESILLNQSRLLPVATCLQGEYGLNDVVIGVPCRLGCAGVENILELHLTDGEREAVQISAQSVRDQYDPAQKILAMN
ncbi:Malate dehydrogenase [Nodularia spumigena CCY9414]|nr:Malate dehydrogenase [Nodularia spumigena CCY9414]EAW46719.1 Malate dehydrogenase, NAD-dependent [Nodularia spumigena CCY9414]